MASSSENYLRVIQLQSQPIRVWERDNQSYHLSSAYQLPDPEDSAFYTSVNIQNKPLHKNWYPKIATRKRRLWETARPSHAGEVHVPVAFLVRKVNPEAQTAAPPG